MKYGDFVHLHLHTHFSLLDGACRIPELMSHVKSLGMSAVSQTDHGTLAGMVEFLREAKSAGVKPIVGCEFYVANGSRKDRVKVNDEYAWHLTLLAKNATGVRNLIKLSSLSYLEGYYYKPRVDHELLERYSNGIICLSGCLASELSTSLMRGDDAAAKKLAAWYHKVFKDDFYLEIQDNGLEEQRECGRLTVGLADEMGLPAVASSDAHYLKQEDHVAHDILLCVNTKSELNDPKRMRFGTDEFHVRSPGEMWRAMREYDEELLTRTVEIANKVEDNYESLEFGRKCFPSFKVPHGSADSYLEELCGKGLTERYGDAPREIVDRMEYEIDIIKRMKFSSYILIVWDIVRFCRERGIPASARGSACGAVVSYALGISHFCPVEHGLLFERFLDPNRNDPPDIDVDICKKRREEVIEYLNIKYGAECVSRISNIVKMAPKSAMKDVARVVGMDFAVINEATAEISEKLGTTLDSTFNDNEKFRGMLQKNKRLDDVYKYALRLEGTARNCSTHAAGVVITPSNAAFLLPLCLSGKEKVVQSQWMKDDLEAAGFLKMDLLGLRTLTVLTHANRLIGGIDLWGLPLDDADVFRTLQAGDSRGCFQLDGGGMQQLLQKMKPDKFGDIIATVALYRPGPKEAGLIDQYIDTKHGRKKFDHVHELVDKITSETYGVMVYQEQVMQILNMLGSVELSHAYKCIKMISKKRPQEVAKFREEFVTGAKRLVGVEKANKIFDDIEYFAGYSFNKSHATAYAYLAYQTTYLKTHHPLEFMTALMSSEVDGSEREKYLAEHVRDCRRMGIKIFPPDINISEDVFVTAQKEKGCVFPLSAVKGVGEDTVKNVIANRPFKDAFSFIRAVGRADQAEKLVRVGATDCLGPRGPILAMIPVATKEARKESKDIRRGQGFLFAGEEAPAPKPSERVDEITFEQMRKDELELIGFHISHHPFDTARDMISKHSKNTISDIENVSGPVVIACGVVGLETLPTRAGNAARLTVEDDTGSATAVIWAEKYREMSAVGVGWAGVLFGAVKRSGYGPQLEVDRMVAAAEVDVLLTKGVVIRLRGCGPEVLERVHRLAASYPGPTRLYIDINGQTLRCSSNFNVRNDGFFAAWVEEIVGEKCVYRVK